MATSETASSTTTNGASVKKSTTTTRRPPAARRTGRPLDAMAARSLTSDQLLADMANHNSNGGSHRSKLQLQCSDGTLFDVTHEEAMMSSTLWMLLQDVSERRSKVSVRQHTIPIFDVPSASVELALYYCRSLYKQQVEGWESAMHEWEDRFYNLDSKTLCDLAKVASNLDIQPLVDITCRSIAQIMSATEAAHEIRQKFGLDDELRNGMAGFDFDMFNTLDHDLSTDEYELVEFDQPSVDELVNFINGDDNSSSSGAHSTGLPTPNNGTTATTSRHSKPHSGVSSMDGLDGHAASSSAAKKKKKKKKKKKASTASSSVPASDQTSDGHDGDGNDDDDENGDVDGDGDGDGDGEFEEEETMATATTSSSSSNALSRAREELHQKMLLAQQNPSAVFQESEFEDDDDHELDQQIESFRLALESAHLESKPKKKLKPHVTIAPKDVFRICTPQAAAHR